PPSLRRLGDTVESGVVDAIAWDRVWLAKGEARCQLKLGDHVEGAAPKAQATEPTPATPKNPLADGGRQKIHKISAREVDVERGALDIVLEHTAELVGSVQIVPSKDGINLKGIRAGSVLEAVGLQNGDQLRSINGFVLSDPQSSLEAYARLKTADNLAIAVT